jgi:hypothetical protein
MIRDLTFVNGKETSDEQGGDGMGGDKVGVTERSGWMGGD